MFPLVSLDFSFVTDDQTSSLVDTHLYRILVINFYCCTVRVDSITILLFQPMHNLYTLRTLKSHIKTLNNCHYMFRSLMKPPSGGSYTALGQLLSWDPLIYVHYKIVQFVAICRFRLCVRCTLWIETTFQSVRCTRHTNLKNTQT